MRIIGNIRIYITNSFGYPLYLNNQPVDLVLTWTDTPNQFILKFCFQYNIYSTKMSSIIRKCDINEYDSSDTYDEQMMECLEKIYQK